MIENTSPRKIIRIRFGKAGAHPQLAWESQLPLKPCILITTFCFEGNCDSFDLLLDFCYSFICKFDLLRKCGLLAHTSAAFLKNCCTEKLFGCLRLVIGNLISRKTIRIRFGKVGAHPQLAWESQLPPKPCSPLQPSAFEGNCDSSDLLLDFCYSFICKFDLLRKCGLLAHTSPTFLKNCWIKKLFLPAACD